MEMLEFDWDDSNLNHIAKHGVDREEAQEIMLGDPLDIAFEVVNGEDR